jgi:hypothetical protein
MYTQDMLGPDGKPKNGGTQQLSAAQVLCLRAAAHRVPSSAEPTIQADQQPLAFPKPTTHASLTPLAPLDPDVDSEGVPKVPKKRKAPVKGTKGRAGGQGTARGRWTTDTRATLGRPSHASPRDDAF